VDSQRRLEITGIMLIAVIGCTMDGSSEIKTGSVVFRSDPK